MNKKKIYCEAQTLSESKFDKIPFKELQKMVGWIEPPKNSKGGWTITMADGGYFTCKEQSTAQIIADLEEIKAILLKKK